jgi:nitrate reductase molybdenum cofactor assembly chaperone NarJ/NarW
MNRTREILDALADLFEYPASEWAERFDACRHLLNAEGAERAAAFRAFGAGVEGLGLSELQELYTRTFDLNPVCTPEVGYHIFGDTYKRGIFLARLREAEEPYALGQGRQLPDYLPVMLRLVGRLEDEELRAALVGDCLLPAAEKMFEALSKAESPYAGLVRAARCALARDGAPSAAECCAAAV